MTITNTGNRELTFNVNGLPYSLVPDPRTGSLGTGKSQNVTLWRTTYPADSNVLKFQIADNFGDALDVEITGIQDLPTPQELAEKLKTELNKTPSLEETVAFLSKQPTGSTYVTAAAILASANNAADARRALAKADVLDHSLTSQPNVQLAAGVLNVKSDPNTAIAHFQEAEKSSDPHISEAARFWSGVGYVASGQQGIAASYICGDKGTARMTSGTEAWFGQKLTQGVSDLNAAQTSGDCAGRVMLENPAKIDAQRGNLMGESQKWDRHKQIQNRDINKLERQMPR